MVGDDHCLSRERLRQPFLQKGHSVAMQVDGLLRREKIATQADLAEIHDAFQGLGDDRSHPVPAE